ncbi:phosphonate ABC transporter, permease protein PhnE [Lentzea tibetensis]|uniref:Phosphonate ABC transporter, permease protein PhnE n=1 Tax=Lentzea tibetensis TaxID=2591470 RepID=A0A563EQS3_9PSEU|nr:phosphonate ABC transporter, permease protein PhnE [Lentzea tibetensis]TWP50089.1 phosphonate ABC transporter, permease protein PhnE [Lentzea tibetensis]
MTLAPPRRRAPSKLAIAIALVVVTAHVLAWRATDISPSTLVSGWRGMADFLASSLPPDLSVLGAGLDAAVVTLYMGLLGTTLSIPSALALALLSSRATTPGSVTAQAARSVLSFLRSVPDVVFALIFVTAVGLGPFAGVLALVCHNTGVMGKLWAESMDESDRGPRDALRVAGASRAQVAVNAVLPTVLPSLAGLLLYRLDVNVRSSLVLGLVGAGGIGFLINQSIKLFRFDEMVTHILVVLVLVVAVDQLSSFVRRRLGV